MTASFDYKDNTRVCYNLLDESRKIRVTIYGEYWQCTNGGTLLNGWKLKTSSISSRERGRLQYAAEKIRNITRETWRNRMSDRMIYGTGTDDFVRGIYLEANLNERNKNDSVI